MMAKTQFMRFGSLKLENGLMLKDFEIAYEAHGTLNEKKDNAILVFHALSGGSHIAKTLERSDDDERLSPKEYLGKYGYFKEPKDGWWDIAVGPGKAFDSDKHFIVCANMIGGCYGSTGPCSTNPETGKRYGSRFPVITVKDIARSQKMLMGRLGIKRLLAAVGVSTGGLPLLEWSIMYPKSAELFIAIATSATRTRITLSRNNNQKYSITTDPNFNSGDYYEREWPSGWPIEGLKLARMLAHETYVDLDAREIKNEVVPNDRDLDKYNIQNPIESFMHREGNRFVQRFDANTFVKVLDFTNTYDVKKAHGAKELYRAFRKVAGEYLVISISDDYCFYPEESKELFDALDRAGVKAHYRIIHSSKGHDAFLVEGEKVNDAISPILNRAYDRTRNVA